MDMGNDMFKTVKWSSKLFIKLILLACFLVWIFHTKNEGYTDSSQLLSNSPLSIKAKDIAYLRNIRKFDSYTFGEIQRLGQKILRDLGVNGFGASLVVIDDSLLLKDGTKLDKSINTFPDENIDHTETPKKSFLGYLFDPLVPKLTHGMAVSSTAASFHKDSVSLAPGAHVMQIGWGYCDQEKQEIMYNENYEIRRINEQVNFLSSELEKFNNIENSLSGVQKKDIESELEKERIKLRELRDKIRLKNNKYNFELFRVPISHSVLDEMEMKFTAIKATNVAMPRVINISLGFPLNYADHELNERLANFLEKYDLLIIMAAGNDSKPILLDSLFPGDNGVSFDSSEKWYDSSVVLCSIDRIKNRILFVGAHDNIYNMPACYSNFAGNAEANTMFANGNLNIIMKTGEWGTFKPSGQSGTSLAAPHVAAMAVVLGKYFPNFTMIEIKKIILDSTYHSICHDEKQIGQGALDPLQAWIYAVEYEASKKEQA